MAPTKRNTEEEIDDLLSQWTEANKIFLEKKEAYTITSVYSEEELATLNEYIPGEAAFFHNVKANPKFFQKNMNALAELNLATQKLTKIQELIIFLSNTLTAQSES